MYADPPQAPQGPPQGVHPGGQGPPPPPPVPEPNAWANEPIGLQRLKDEYLDRLPAAPPGLPVEYQYEDIWALQQEHVRQSVIPEFVDPRLDLWAWNMGNLTEPQNWHTLQPSKNLVEYKEVLKDDLGIEHAVCVDFVELLGKGEIEGASWGYQEGCRVLAHLLKDSAEGTSWRSSPSGWLKKAVEESNQAILSWQAWDANFQDPPAGQGKGSSASGSSDPWGAYRPSGSSEGKGRQTRGFR